MVLNDFLAVGLTFTFPQSWMAPALQGNERTCRKCKPGSLNLIGKRNGSSQELWPCVSLKTDALSLTGAWRRLDGGWRRRNLRLSKKAIFEQHVFFPAGVVHDAFVHIRDLFKGAHREIFVGDGYVDSSIFQFLLSTNSTENLQDSDELETLAEGFSRRSQSIRDAA
jgi:hypothetical protein